MGRSGEGRRWREVGRGEGRDGREGVDRSGEGGRWRGVGRDEGSGVCLTPFFVLKFTSE